mmetsp:Transcript_3852/g.5088  ORF Transcript_3852/g.5088 Transcript_3852/m.5088 type:complete len:86 (+) Transcript_3852:1822-2079(+)
MLSASFFDFRNERVDEQAKLQLKEELGHSPSRPKNDTQPQTICMTTNMPPKSLKDRKKEAESESKDLDHTFMEGETHTKIKGSAM